MTNQQTTTARGPVTHYDGRIIDMHAHLWLGRVAHNRREILEACERHKIERIYLSALAGQYPTEDQISQLNQAVADFVADEPERIGGMCYVNPRHKNALDVLRKGFEEQRMSGMKLWIETYCDDPLVNPLIEWCIREDRPVLIHAFKKAIGQLADESLGTHVARLAQRYPEAKLMMAHIGGSAYDGVRPVVPYPNVSIDISGSFFRGDELNYAVELVGAGRMLFGTDIPGSFASNFGQVLEADLTRAERDLIMHANADRLFGGK